MTSIVNIGGEVFYLDDHSSINMVAKNKDKFNAIFGGEAYKGYGLERIKTLFTTYLPHPAHQLDSISTEDKQDLLAILTIRLTSLTHSNAHTNNTLVKQGYAIYIPTLRELIRTLEGPTKGPSNVVKRVQTLTLTDPQLFMMILRLSWFLTHPSSIEGEKESEWKKLLDASEQLNLFDVVNSIKSAPRVNVKVVRDSTDLNAALHATQHPADATQFDNLKERFQAILQILAADKYITSADENLSLNEIKALTGKLPKSAAPLDNEQKAPLFTALGPIFTSIFDLYGDVYTSLVKGTMKDAIIDIPSLSILLAICNDLFDKGIKGINGKPPQYGIFQLTNVPVSMVTFITNQLQATGTYLTQLPKEDQSSFREKLATLSTVRLSTLINKFGGKANYTDRANYPFLQLYVNGVNIDVLKNESKKKTKTSNSLYIMVAESLDKLAESVNHLTDKPAESVNKVDATPFLRHSIDFSKVVIKDGKADITSTPIESIIVENGYNKEHNLIMNTTQLVLCLLSAIHQTFPATVVPYDTEQDRTRAALFAVAVSQDDAHPLAEPSINQVAAASVAVEPVPLESTSIAEPLLQEPRNIAVASIAVPSVNQPKIEAAVPSMNQVAAASIAVPSVNQPKIEAAVPSMNQVAAASIAVPSVNQTKIEAAVPSTKNQVAAASVAVEPVPEHTIQNIAVPSAKLAAASVAV
jgi:hypothetical protein